MASAPESGIYFGAYGFGEMGGGHGSFVLADAVPQDIDGAVRLKDACRDTAIEGVQTLREDPSRVWLTGIDRLNGAALNGAAP